MSLSGSSDKHEYLHLGKHPLAQFRGLWLPETATQELIFSDPVFQATNTRILCAIGYVPLGFSWLHFWFGKRREVTLHAFRIAHFEEPFCAMCSCDRRVRCGSEMSSTCAVILCRNFILPNFRRAKGEVTRLAHRVLIALSIQTAALSVIAESERITLG
jgi:hypothetical protein